jgi:hypothetical protein
MSCVGTIDLPPSLKKYENNCFNTNKATTVKINCPNGFQFGDTVFQEAALTSLYLNVDQYFAYPNKFLDGAQIISNPTAKIYVPSRLLTAFQNG